MNEAIEAVTDVYVKSVLIESERLVSAYEISNVVTDIDIYEHLEKPYLTAKLAFIDTESIISANDILGGEKITITLKSNRKKTLFVKKSFYINAVQKRVKLGDSMEVISLHLIEDIGYLSNLFNVNKSYQGNTYTIISKISKEYLSKSILADEKLNLDEYKVIVPNLDPLEAISWLKNKTNTKDGLPFFVYSSLVGDTLTFRSLSNMLTSTVMNRDYPYTYWQSGSQSNDPNAQRRTIKSYIVENTENLFSLIRDGVVGANYSYLNTLTGINESFTFDVQKDAFNKLKAILPKAQNNIQYSDLFKVNEKSFNQIPSKTVTQIAGAGVYNIGQVSVPSYNEETLRKNYREKIVAKAVLQFLVKNPMQIVVNGIDFLDGETNSTIGNLLRVNFLNNQIDVKQDKNKIDYKTSGDYLIFATRHSFKKEGYEISMSCVKIANKNPKASS